MKEASGELNLTLVTLILIGALVALGGIFKDNIEDLIKGLFEKTADDTVYNSTEPLEELHLCQKLDKDYNYYI